jgi:hypothetical protein
MCRLLGVRVGAYLREAYVLPVLLSLPLVGTQLLVRHWFIARTYIQVGLQILISLVPYGLGVLWALWTKRIWTVGKLSDEQMDEVAVALIETYQEEP